MPPEPYSISLSSKQHTATLEKHPTCKMCTTTLKYWDESSFETDVWPCRCTDPVQACEGSFWECSHGRWLFVDDATLARQQATEILSGKSDDFRRANDLGILWGDMMLAWEDEAMKNQTPAEKAAREALKRKEIQADQKSLVDSHVNKFKDIYCDRKNGELKKRELRPCKWFCACFCDRGDCSNNGGRARALAECRKVVGKAAPGGKGWTPGCAAHLKHACPFIHPDESEWSDALNGSRPGSANHSRDFSALKSHHH